MVQIHVCLGVNVTLNLSRVAYATQYSHRCITYKFNINGFSITQQSLNSSFRL